MIEVVPTLCVRGVTVKTESPIAYSYIRFSDPGQAKGDSVRRQLEETEKFCREMGFDLDGALSFRDLGVSSFRGKNAKSGALSVFLQAIRDEKVEPGSVLIVEDVDRLSRQEPLDSLELVSDILKAGVMLITLMDRQRYTRESLATNPGQLFILLGKTIRAHEESRTKSLRVKAWREQSLKAARADGTAIDQRLPGWIRRNGDRLELIEARAAIMRRAVALAIEGYGAVKITHVFNHEHVPHISNRSTTTAWTSSVVQFFLRSRLLLGEYQPTRIRDDGIRVPSGDPIRSYYPALLDEPTFYRLQAVLDLRATGKQQGSEGKYVANLFGRLLANGVDGTTCYLVQKRQHNVNLISRLMRDGLAPVISFPYHVLETAFFQWVHEVQLSTPNKHSSPLLVLNHRHAEIVERISEVHKRISAPGGHDFGSLLDALELLTRQERQIAKEIDDERRAEEKPAYATADIVQLGEAMRGLQGDDLQQLRIRLRIAIASAVQQIEIFPATGVSPLVRHAVVIVWLRDGSCRLWELRAERNRTPVTIAHGINDLIWETDHPDNLRTLAANFAIARALLSYSELMDDPLANTVTTLLPFSGNGKTNDIPAFDQESAA